MAVLRWGVGAVLVSLLLLWGLLPEPLRQMGDRQVVRAQEEQKKAPRVYTNDDWPFNRPRSTSRSAEKEKAANPSSPPVRKAERLAPFVATPMPVVEKMLEMAQVTSRDVVYDLGSGDGRIVIMAAQKYGARAVGVELNRALAQESEEKARELNLEGLVTIIQGDLLQTSVTPASVVAIYLLPEANETLRPMLERDLRPGSRVVAHDIRIPGWRPAREEAVTIGGGTHFVYLYKIPEAFR